MNNSFLMRVRAAVDRLADTQPWGWGGVAFKWTGGHGTISMGCARRSRGGGVLGVEIKNVSDNCPEMPSPEEKHQFHLLVGSWPVRHTFPVPFS